MAKPRQRRNDHRFLPVGDLEAGRANAFSRYATLARKNSFSSRNAPSGVGSGSGLGPDPLGLPLRPGLSASAPPARYARHQASNVVTHAIAYRSITTDFATPRST